MGKGIEEEEDAIDEALPPDPIRNTAAPEPGVPFISSIEPNYTGMLLVGFSVPVRLKVTVDWNGSDPGDGNPGAIEFDLNGHVTTLAASGTVVTWQIDTDRLDAGLSPYTNQVSIVARNAEADESLAFRLSLPAVDIGPWFWVGDNEYRFDGAHLVYKSTIKVPPWDFGGSEEGHSWIPLLSKIGTELNPIEVEIEYSTEGTGKVTVKALLASAKLDIFEAEIGGEGSGELALLDDTVHLTRLEASLFGKATIETPKAPLPWPPLSWIMWQAAIKPELKATYGLIETGQGVGPELVPGLQWQRYAEIEAKFGA